MGVSLVAGCAELVDQRQAIDARHDEVLQDNGGLDLVGDRGLPGHRRNNGNRCRAGWREHRRTASTDHGLIVDQQDHDMVIRQRHNRRVLTSRFDWIHISAWPFNVAGGEQAFLTGGQLMQGQDFRGRLEIHRGLGHAVYSAGRSDPAQWCGGRVAKRAAVPSAPSAPMPVNRTPIKSPCQYSSTR